MFNWIKSLVLVKPELPEKKTVRRKVKTKTRPERQTCTSYFKVVDSLEFIGDGRIKLLFADDYFGDNFAQGGLFLINDYIFHLVESELIEIKVPQKPLFSELLPIIFKKGIIGQKIEVVHIQSC